MNSINIETVKKYRTELNYLLDTLKKDSRFKLEGAEKFEFIDPSNDDIYAFKLKNPNIEFRDLEIILACKPKKFLVVSDLRKPGNQLIVHGNEMFLSCDNADQETYYSWPFMPLISDCEYNTLGFFESENFSPPRVAYVQKENTYDKHLPDVGEGIDLSNVIISDIPQAIQQLLSNNEDFFLWPLL